ncbi:MAG: MFS transporter [Proteobacteria bacterium]|nr:MFS transporter [Pseudomonadota bacterium]
MFLTLLFPYFLSNFFRPFLAVVAGDLSRDFGFDAAGLAGLQATFLLAFALTQVPVALSLDRFGPRRILILGLTGAVAGGVLLSLADRSWQVTAAMALLGAGFSPVMMAGFYVIGRVYSPARFATMSSLLFGLGTLGDPVSGAPLTLAVAAFGWRPTIFAMAGVTLVSLLLIAIVLRDPPRVEAPGGRISALAATQQIVAIRALWPIAPMALICYAVVAAVRGLWIAPYLAQVHHFGTQAVGLSATAMGLALAMGGVLYAPANRYLRDAKVTLVVGTTVAVIGWLVLGLFGNHSGALSLALLFAVAGFGASFAILLAHARAFLPAHLLGQGVTMMNLLFFGGAGIGQWLSGHYVKAAAIANVAPDLIYGRLFTAFGIVLALALGIYLLSPRERSAWTSKV